MNSSSKHSPEPESPSPALESGLLSEALSICFLCELLERGLVGIVDVLVEPLLLFPEVLLVTTFVVKNCVFPSGISVEAPLNSPVPVTFDTATGVSCCFAVEGCAVGSTDTGVDVVVAPPITPEDPFGEPNAVPVLELGGAL